jgi:type III secretion system FlhB-like substrate exporter
MPPKAAAARGTNTGLHAPHLCAGYLHIDEPLVQQAQQVGVPLQLELNLLLGNGGFDAPKLCREFL